MLSERSERYWYGWKVGLVGSTGAVLMSIGVATERSTQLHAVSTVTLALGIPIFLLGGPVVHWSHEQLGKGLISLGMNVAVPVIAGLIGSAGNCAESSTDSGCRADGFWAGAALAALIVPWVDGLLLGWGETTLERTVTSAAGARANIRPWLALGRSEQILVGLGGEI